MQEGNADTPAPTCGLSAVAIAFNWEKEPGLPIIVEEVTATADEQPLSPLTPPPSYRKAGSCVLDPGHFAFSGFEPEENARRTGAQLADKIRKKVVKMRQKSHSAANCFSLDAFRGRLYVSDDSERAYDSDQQSGSPVSALDEQPDTPCSSNSSLGSSSAISSTSSSSDTRRHGRNAGAPSPSPQQPSSQLMANVLLSLYPLDNDDDVTEDGDASEDGDKLTGPRESAWHQPEEADEEDYRDRLRQEWKLVRYRPKPQARSSLFSSISRQASKVSLTQNRLRSSRLWEQPRSSLWISRTETR